MKHAAKEADRRDGWEANSFEGRRILRMTNVETILRYLSECMCVCV